MQIILQIYLAVINITPSFGSMIQERKEKLIQQLKNERSRLKERVDVIDHDVTIEYLIRGSTNTYPDPDIYPLLDACINDPDQILRDYNC